jgi:hypothetical protein
MMDFNHVPAFLLERAIGSLERLRGQLDNEISLLRHEQNARDWQSRRRQHMQKITHDLITKGSTDEHQAIAWLCEQGHRPEYARQILSTMQTRIESEKKAAREVEIFWRWNHRKEKKAALAREYGLSRATVERICRKLAANGEGLKKIFNATKRNDKLWTKKNPKPTI